MNARFVWCASLLAVIACGGKSTTGGSGGSGASAGNGGTGAASGGGTSGNGGGSGGGATGGSGGSGGTPCDELAQGYADMLATAKLCDPFIDENECTLQVENALICPCGPTFVNPGNTSALDALKQLQGKWDAQMCGADIDCPAIGCETPALGACQVDPSGAMGSCQDLFTNGG